VPRPDLELLFKPRSVCIIGASAKQNKVGGQVTINLISCKFQGEIYPINPKYDKLYGIKAFKSLSSIESKIDLAVITIPNIKVPAVLEECVANHVKFAVIITAGFGEMVDYDPKGRELRNSILHLLKKSDLRIVGPNCMGVVCSQSNLVALMGLGFPPGRQKVNASIISQSGTWGITTLRAGTVQGLGISKFVSSGNELDLKFEDYLEYLGTDQDTQVILGFIEGLRQGRRFVRLIEEIEKPIVLIKGGRTKSGRATARSHTGSMAGSLDLYRGVFKQYGVIEVDSMEELVDMGRAFAQCLMNDPPKFPKGNRVGVTSGGGGYCVLMADYAEAAGLELAQLDQSTIEKLNKILPPYWPHRNPVDLVASWEFSTYPKVIRALLEDPNIDAVIARPPLGFSLMMENEDVQQFVKENPITTIGMPKDLIRGFDLSMVRDIGRVVKRSSKPVILPLGFYTAEAPTQYDLLREILKRGILIAPSGQAAAKILKNLYNYHKYQEKINEMKKKLRK